MGLDGEDGADAPWIPGPATVFPELVPEKLTPANNTALPANCSVVVNRSYTVASGKVVSLGLGSRMRIL